MNESTTRVRLAAVVGIFYPADAGVAATRGEGFSRPCRRAAGAEGGVSLSAAGGCGLHPARRGARLGAAGGVDDRPGPPGRGGGLRPFRRRDFVPEVPPTTQSHGANLLALARDSIRSGLETGTHLPIDYEHLPVELADIGASFISLYRQGRLRGCIGSTRATRSLAEDIAANMPLPPRSRTCTSSPSPSKNWTAPNSRSRC